MATQIFSVFDSSELGLGIWIQKWDVEQSGSVTSTVPPETHFRAPLCDRQSQHGQTLWGHLPMLRTYIRLLGKRAWSGMRAAGLAPVFASTKVATTGTPSLPRISPDTLVIHLQQSALPQATVGYGGDGIAGRHKMILLGTASLRQVVHEVSIDIATASPLLLTAIDRSCLRNDPRTMPEWPRWIRRIQL
jgi:hypothetical protein